MAIYLGLDIGTTNLGVVAWEAESDRLLASITSPNTAARGIVDGRAELDLGALRVIAAAALRQAVAALADRAGQVRAVGVTGQQHGLALLGPNAEPLGPAITWQDRRVLEPMPGKTHTFLQRFLDLAGGPEAFERTGCLPAAGYLGPSLFWLQQQGRLPAPPAQACFIPDAVVAFLTGRPPCTDPTDGGSSGILDIVARCWDTNLLERLSLPTELLPPVWDTGTQAGELLPTLADQVGLPRHTPVAVALGDNQASFLGSVRAPAASVLINIGTGAQVSVLVQDYCRLEGLDTRYYPGQRYLLVGAGLFGGRTYAYLESFLRQVGTAFFGATGNESLFEAMDRLAAAVPAGCDGLACVPYFTGTRSEPSVRASYSGLSPQNLTPGHLIRALLEGMAEAAHTFYARMSAVAGPRHWLVGSGNGIRRNAVFGQILAERFGLPLHLPALQEEAAVGAALCAAVACGDCTWESASAALRYASLEETGQG